MNILVRIACVQATLTGVRLADLRDCISGLMQII